MNATTRNTLSLFSVVVLSAAVGGGVAVHFAGPSPVLAASPAPAPVTANPAEVDRLTPDTFRGVARRETDGVVNISTTKVVKRGIGGEDAFRYFFGSPGSPFGGETPRPDKQTQTSLGSGFVVDKDGYILTNRHVVNEADQIVVTFPSGKKYDAKLVGQDARTDVALLKIEPREVLTVIAMGNSDQADVGEWVMAIGNPFGLGGNSVTVGVVSYKGRPLDLATKGTPVEMLQTDASINPGNSGGPLLNEHGEAIGINTLMITQGVAQSAGVGFAVPINTAKEILPQLRATGSVVRGWLGVQVQAVDEDLAKSLKLQDAKGALIADVTAGSPAEKAGLKAGDVVVELDGHPIDNGAALSRQVASKAPGSALALEVVRDGSPRKVTATLGTFPEERGEAEGDENAKGRIGVSLRPVTPDFAATVGLPADTHGLFVADVVAGSKAEGAGLQSGDVIVSVNGQEVVTVDGFKAAVAKAESDGLARLRVRRANGSLFLVLKLK
jgi:serine protease Do